MSVAVQSTVSIIKQFVWGLYGQMDKSPVESASKQESILLLMFRVRGRTSKWWNKSESRIIHRTAGCIMKGFSYYWFLMFVIANDWRHFRAGTDAIVQNALLVDFQSRGGSGGTLLPPAFCVCLKNSGLTDSQINLSVRATITSLCLIYKE